MVDVQSYTPANPEEDAWGQIAGGGMRKFDKFADENPVGSGQYVDRPIGTTFTGVVAENPKSYHAMDYDTKEPKFYKSGQPILEVEIVIDTAERLDDEDDGRRRFRAGQIGKAALKAEMDRLGIKRFGVGTQITVTFTGYRKNTSGRASKLMSIDLVPAEFVPAQQQQVDAAMSQAGYVEQAAAAGFPPAAVAAPQPPVAVVAAPQPPVAVVAAPAPVAAAAVPAVDAAVPTLEQVGQVRMMTKIGIPRQNALAAVVGQVGGSAEFAAALDLMESALPQ